MARLSPSNPVSVVGNNPAPSAIGAVIGTQIFNSAAAASEVVTETVNVGGMTAGNIRLLATLTKTHAQMTKKIK